MRRRSPRLIAIAGASMTLALTSVVGPGAIASGAIIVNQGIGPVRVGDTATQVRRKLGPPSTHGTCSRYSGLFPCGRTIQFWEYTTRDLQLLLLQGRVAQLDTTSTSERTRSGIGPGVRLSDVRKTYPHGSEGTMAASIYGYFLTGFPKHDGDAFTAAYISGNRRNTVADVVVGRWQKHYECDFFACQ